MFRMMRLLAGSLVLVLAACATSGAPRAATTSANPNVLTEAELAPHADAPLRQTIQRLRPQFLRNRGASSITQASSDRILVYMGSSRLGGVEVLDQLRTRDVREIRYLTPSEATQRFGLNQTSGAIVLVPR